MPETIFSGIDGLDDDLNKFLEELDGKDAAMASIFRANVNVLRAATTDAERKAARVKFNRSVRMDLDKMLQEGE